MEIMDSVGFPGYVVPRCDVQQTVGCLSGAQIDLRQFQYTHTYQGIETKKGICRKRMCRKDDKKRGPEKSLLIPHRQTGRKATERKQQGERIVYNGKMKLPEGKNKNQPPNQTKNWLLIPAEVDKQQENDTVVTSAIVTLWLPSTHTGCRSQNSAKWRKWI